MSTTPADAATSAFPGAAAALVGQPDDLVRRWLSAHAAHWMRLPRPLPAGELDGAVRGLVDALAGGLPEPGVIPGHGHLREAEKRVAFVGGSFGQRGASAFDVAAFVLAGRDVLLAEARHDAERVALGRLFDWFVALALEGYATSRQEGMVLAHREALERGTPVVMISPDLPAVLLVGDPDRSVLESAVGRLLLAVVRVGAKALIVDATGLGRADAPAVLDAVHGLASHRKIAGAVQLLLVGVPAAAEAAWSDSVGGPTRCRFCDRFEDAVALGLAAGGQRLARA